MTFFEGKLLPVMSKIAEQKHLRAIRNGIVSTIPIIIIGSFFLIFLNIPLDPLGISWQKDVLDAINPALKTHILMAFRLTSGLMSLYAAFGIGVALGKEYKLDATMTGLAGTVAFLFSVVPVSVTADMVKTLKAAQVDSLLAGQYLSIDMLGAKSLFGAIIYALIAVEIVRLFKKYRITIRMHESVPAAVSNSFEAMFSIGFIVVFVWLLRFVIGFDVNDLVSKALSPLSQFLVGDNIFGVILIVFLITFFWSFGLHGVSLIGTMVRPFWEQAIVNNSEAFSATGSATLIGENALPHMFTEQFLQWYVWIGGSGATIGLVFLLLFARSEFLKQMGRVTIVPSLFNINEPVIFGLPIVMNPILIIPFIVAPILMTVFAGIMQMSGFVNGMVFKAPWNLPGPLGAWMGTNFDYRAILICLGCIVISIIVYFPFFRAYDKQLLKQEQEAEASHVQ